MALGTVNGCVVNFIPVNGRLVEVEEEQIRGRPPTFREWRPLPEPPKSKPKPAIVKAKPKPQVKSAGEILQEAFIVPGPVEDDEFALLNMLFGRVR